MTVLARAKVVLEGDAAHLHGVFASAESALQKVGRRMEEAGRDLSTKLTLPLLGVGGAAVKTAATFDETMRKIVAMTGVSRDQVEAWRDQVRELAVEFGSTGEKAADALFFIASAGIEGDRAMEALQASLKGTVIGLGETKVVADAATSAMNAYSKQGLTATRATEILAAGIKFGKFEAENLAPVLGSLTGTASALNISFADVVGTLAVFSRTGTDAAEGATQLSAIMSTLLGTSEEGEKLLTEQGLSLEKLREVAAGPRGLVNVMRILDQAFTGQVDKLRTIIPNVRAFRGVMNALAQDTDIVNGVLDGTADSFGFLDKALGEMQGPAHAMRQAWAQIKDALIAVGNVLIPIVIPGMKAVAAFVRDTAKTFAGLPPEIQKVIVVFLGLTAAVGPVLLVLGSFMKIVGLIKLSALIGGVSMLGTAFSSLWAALKGFVFLSGIQGAFAAAAVAGTGFKGVLIGLAPVFKTLMVAMAPFIAGTAIVAGLALIVAKWVEMKVAVAKVTQAVRESNAEMDKALSGMSVKQAAAAYTRLALIVQNTEKRIAELKKKQEENTRAVDASSDRQGSAAAAARRLNATLQEQQNELQATADHYRHQLGILGQVVQQQQAVTTVTQQGVKAIAKIPTWITPAKEAMTEYHKSLAQVATMERLLGDQYDDTKARIETYTEAVKALTAAGVPLDAVVGQNGETLRILGQRLVLLKTQVTATEQAEEKFKDAISEATRAVEEAMTPVQLYDATIAALNTAVEAGKITWEQYDAAVRKAKETMEEATSHTKEVKQAMVDLGKDAISDFVDAVFAAKKNWGDFFRTMIHDISKLIIKMMILNALFPKDKGPGGIIGDIFGFARGGFLPGGDVGLVGERGPELVMAGRNGVTISPMPAMAGGGSGAGPFSGVPVQINVNALDSRDVVRFFEENEGLVAGAIMRAQQRSSLLRR